MQVLVKFQVPYLPIKDAVKGITAHASKPEKGADEELTCRSWGVSNSYKIEKLNQLIRGWISLNVKLSLTCESTYNFGILKISESP